jgi:class 3 adenylate cyclase
VALRPTGPAAAVASAPISAAAEAAGAAERRYLTVMFCDLVGSTDIAAQLSGAEVSPVPLGTFQTKRANVAYGAPTGQFRCGRF